MPAPRPKMHEDNPREFTWTSPDGGTVTVPAAGRIPMRVLLAMQKRPDTDQVEYLLEQVCDEPTRERVLDLGARDFADFFRAWQAGANLPES